MTGRSRLGPGRPRSGGDDSETSVRHHGGVLIARRVPRPGTRLSAALTAAETTTALAIAHTAAGGELPSPGWLLVVASTVYGAAALVLRRNAPLRATVAALVGAQIVLHAWLVTLTTELTAYTEPAAHTAHAADGGPLGLSWAMLGAHLVAGAVTALALAVRRRAVAVLLSWQDSPRLVVPLRTRYVSDAPRALATAGVRTGAPTRGPPAAALATT